MWSRGIGGAAVVVAIGAIAALPASGDQAALNDAPASAGSEPPRQAYSERFTTDVPGASTGRTYAIDWVNPDDPEGKPHSFSHLHVELAEGARFDTSAVAQCDASDAELMAAGASACPPESKVATDESVLDTGFPDPGRYVTSDFVFFNNKDELILLATVRENGLRVVLRAQIGKNTIDLDVPILPGTPPDGGAATSQRGQWDPRSSVRDGKQANYLTTPPTCPASGFWVNRITYTYRDGITQTVESKSPCKRPGEPAADVRAPRIRAAGIPLRCATRRFRVRFRIADASRLRSVRLHVDRRRIATSRRKRLSVRILVGRLRAGRHTISVTAIDAAGNSSERRFGFRRCGK
jgi:hypothetical protein